MMQEVLVAIALIAAVVYLARYIYKSYFAKKTKCESCAVHKIYEAKQASHKKG